MNGESYTDLIDSLPGYALKTGATLCLADHIAAGHRLLIDLARAADTEPKALERLMRYLCCRGIFGVSVEAGYHLTEFSRLLLDDHPSRLRRSLDLDGYGGRIDHAISHLPEVIRSGRSCYSTIFGKPFYEDIIGCPELLNNFLEVRGRQASLHGHEINHHVSLTEGSHVVDVGGGTGELLMALLTNRTGISGTVFDLPVLAQAAAAAITANHAGEYVSFIGGDFFESIPHGDLHILSNTLFNWDDCLARDILRNCLNSSTTGKILVVEQIPDEFAPREEELALDLCNLAVNGGRQRTCDEFERLARWADLEVAKKTQLKFRSLFLLELHRCQP